MLFFNISMALPNLERVIPPPPPELRPFTPKDLENLFLVIHKIFFVFICN
jgi:hypothetical protein